MAVFVRDPHGVVHKLDPYPHPEYGLQTFCEQDVLYSAKWASVFPALAKVTCLGCIGVQHPHLPPF